MDDRDRKLIKALIRGFKQVVGALEAIDKEDGDHHSHSGFNQFQNLGKMKGADDGRRQHRG